MICDRKPESVWLHSKLPGFDDRPALLLEAKLYLDEIQSRRDIRVAGRDLALEIIVIVLIGIEIILGVIGIVVGIREGHQQYQVLSNLNASSTDTAKSLRSLYEEQQRLVEVQKKNLDSVSSMNSAMQNQLLVLRQDQKEKLAELAKKPRLQLSVGGVQLLPMPERPIKARELTPTHALFELVLKNEGDATARLFTVMISTQSKEVTLTEGFANLRLASDMPGKAILVPVERLLSDQWTLITLKLDYPAGTQDFTLTFSASGENVAKVLLGAVEVRPPAQ